MGDVPIGKILMQGRQQKQMPNIENHEKSPSTKKQHTERESEGERERETETTPSPTILTPAGLPDASYDVVTLQLGQTRACRLLPQIGASMLSRVYVRDAEIVGATSEHKLWEPLQLSVVRSRTCERSFSYQSPVVTTRAHAGRQLQAVSFPGLETFDSCFEQLEPGTVCTAVGL